MYRAVIDIRGLYASGEEWKSRFLKICDDLLEIPSDLRGEAAVQQSLIEAFGDLKIYDELLRDRSEQENIELILDVEVIREFIKFSLRSISGGYGDYLTEGVTISALQPMRPIPLQHCLRARDGGRGISRSGRCIIFGYKALEKAYRRYQSARA